MGGSVASTSLRGVATTRQSNQLSLRGVATTWQSKRIKLYSIRLPRPAGARNDGGD